MNTVTASAKTPTSARMRPRACGLAVHGAKANPLTGVAPVLIGRAQRAQRSGTSAALRYRVGCASATVAAASMTSTTAVSTTASAMTASTGAMTASTGAMAAATRPMAAAAMAGPIAATVAGTVSRRPVDVDVPIDVDVPVVPAVPAGAAAPAEPAPPGIAAPVPPRALPARSVPAEVPAAPDKLRLLHRRALGERIANGEATDAERRRGGDRERNDQGRRGGERQG